MSNRAVLQKADYGEPCPICAKYIDPETGDPRFNEETLAAFAEGDAMERGEIPTIWYNSVEEMWASLEAEEDE